MILIQALSREGFIRRRGNLVRELRHFPEGVLKSAQVELGSSWRGMGSLFKQPRGIRLKRVATFFLTLSTTYLCPRLKPAKTPLHFNRKLGTTPKFRKDD